METTIDLQQDIICINCQAKLNDEALENELKCTTCHSNYPIINGIPILIDDSNQFFTEAALIYNAHIKIKEKQIESIKNAAASNLLRRNALKSIAFAMTANIEVVKKMLTSILPYVPKENLLDLGFYFENRTEFGNYLNDFLYLRRDWTWLPEGEKQLSAINNTLKETLKKHLSDFSSVFLAGAGFGRTASELTPLFDTVYASDKSYSIAYNFQKLFEEDIYFYEVYNCNVPNNRNLIRHLKASFLPPHNKTPNKDYLEMAKKVKYFVSDIMNIPLADESVSAFLSVYFTDVLALKLYFAELIRILKPNGLYIHFGPFGYPFQSIAEKLLPDDVRTIFIQNGFEILEDRFIKSNHMESSNSIEKTTLHNWVFVARKMDKSQLRNINISDDSILSFNGNLNFTTNGQLSNENFHKSTQLVLNNGTIIEGADTMLEVLSFVDGTNTLKDIIAILAEEYEIDAAIKQILFDKIKDLVKKEVLFIS